MHVESISLRKRTTTWILDRNAYGMGNFRLFYAVCSIVLANQFYVIEQQFRVHLAASGDISKKLTQKRRFHRFSNNCRQQTVKRNSKLSIPSISLTKVRGVGSKTHGLGTRSPHAPGSGWCEANKLPEMTVSADLGISRVFSDRLSTHFLVYLWIMVGPFGTDR